jgi:hypothetical protein
MWARIYPSGRVLTALNVEVLCGRCERPFFVRLKKGEDNPRFACRTCGVENKVPVVWENQAPGGAGGGGGSQEGAA